MGFFNILILIFFSTQFNNNKKKLSNPRVQPDPCGLGWVGLGWIFFDSPWWVGSKNPLNLTQPDPCTPLGETFSHLKLHRPIAYDLWVFSSFEPLGFLGSCRIQSIQSMLWWSLGLEWCGIVGMELYGGRASLHSMVPLEREISGHLRGRSCLYLLEVCG